jgi:tetrahydromethanopterin S-methyltransferase subunit G
MISAISFSIIAGGFYFSTKQRLDKIERDLFSHNKINTEIVDRLARIETKLDFVTKK